MPEHQFYRKYGKRCCDLALATIGLPFFVAVSIPVAIAIKLEDKGPIFYNAPRLGKNGEIFKMFKFRSMKVNAPDLRLKDGSTYNSRNDPRVTKVGKILRKTSIDELPQIMNVIKNEMSFIGPRPDPPDWINKYPEDIKKFLKVKPGVTGYNQAYFRNSVDGNEKMNNDLFYSEQYSFDLDIKILIKTIDIVIKGVNTFKSAENEQNKLNEKSQVLLKQMI